ncbi:MAG: GNAT family N-acetyltransferase [Clostridiales bacterium]|jgi:GNAT superfamily N-acetyltransferase|nr:GNAT family N-acetyltransferase [Clostridiales bacterium]
MSELKIRTAAEGDCALILSFIRELAEYENMLDEVVATQELLREWLFEKQKAEVIIGEVDEKPVAFALFFHNFSTFLGRAGIYLEDLYVRPDKRGAGIGKKMLAHLARIAIERGCGRLEWACLDWNESGIAFYLSLGAKPLNGWTLYRVTGDTLRELAQ